MPKAYRRDKLVFKRINAVKDALRKGPLDRKAIMGRMRRIGDIDLSRRTEFELRNLKRFLETSFYQVTLGRVSGLKAVRNGLIKKVDEALRQKRHFPKGAVIRIGGQRFSANTLYRKIWEKLEAAKNAARLEGTKIDTDAITANAIADSLAGKAGKSAKTNFLDWRKANPKKAFHLWIHEHLESKR